MKIWLDDERQQSATCLLATTMLALRATNIPKKFLYRIRANQRSLTTESLQPSLCNARYTIGRFSSSFEWETMVWEDPRLVWLFVCEILVLAGRRQNHGGGDHGSCDFHPVLLWKQWFWRVPAQGSLARTLAKIPVPPGRRQNHGGDHGSCDFGRVLLWK